MIRRIILSGYGNVGRRFVELLKVKRYEIKNRYGLELLLCGVMGSRGMIFDKLGLDIDLLLACGVGSEGILNYGKIKPKSLLNDRIFSGDLLVEATPTNIDGGQPALGIILNALEEGMDIVSISKGALVSSFSEIMDMASDRGVRIKYSGATAAALPTMDIGEYCLASSEINSIRGILNGTTNYILTSMQEENISFEAALKAARERGMAEANCKNDISGLDSACKLLLLSNSLLGTRYSLKEINFSGIDNISVDEIRESQASNYTLKLIARAVKWGEKAILSVGVEKVCPEDLLYGVRGANKGVVFETDTMGEIAALGGASNPGGAAAAALKDIINLYR